LAADEFHAFVDPDEPMRMFSSGQEPIIPKSPDRVFDRALAETLAKLSATFGVIPGFAYYDDYDGKNALASDEVRMNGADGTVLFGTRLLGHLRSGKEAPEVAVSAVCAHEFGHILQYKRNLVGRILGGQSTVKRLELHADYLAGVFGGLRRKERPEFPVAVIAVTQRNLGDTQSSNPQHHGTPEERGAAVEAGFMAVTTSPPNFDAIVLQGMEYVARL
jgi:hypothetical protein